MKAKELFEILKERDYDLQIIGKESLTCFVEGVTSNWNITEAEAEKCYYMVHKPLSLSDSKKIISIRQQLDALTNKYGYIATNESDVVSILNNAIGALMEIEEIL